MKSKLRMTQVNQIIELSPHLRRIVLTGNDLLGFPQGMESAHVKVILPQPGQEKPKLEKYLGSEKWMRSYTIRNYNPINSNLAIDFAINDHSGLATYWAANANVGDYLGIAGPGETKYTKYDADWHLIIGDLTALPAIATTLEKMPSDANGYVIAQVPTEQDIQSLKTPQNIHINWVINADLSKNMLLETLQKLKWLQGEPAIFIATETKQMKAMRKYVELQPGFKRELMYASAYWTSK
jgi:NADPH-dependent ferric siderophore reductase